MEKINYLNLTRLRNNEHFQLMSDFSSLIDKSKPLELGIADVYPEFQKSFVLEDKAMKVDLGSVKTEYIHNMDVTRDKVWNAINLRVNATLISPVEAEAKAAEVLKRVIDLYGDQRMSSYNIETAAITNMVSDMLSATNKPHADKIGITSWITALDTQNKMFQSELDSRNKEVSIRENGDVAPARVNVDANYKKIVDKINATIELNLAKPAVSSFVKELNAKLAYYENAVDIRRGRRIAEIKAKIQS